MSSRDQILANILANQPVMEPLPAIPHPVTENENLLSKLKAVLTNIGGELILVGSLSEINDRYADIKSRVITPLVALTGNNVQPYDERIISHDLANVEVALIKAHFAVAENGAVWITDDLMGNRALPYICQHLAIIINIADIVATMHEAYDRIGDHEYGFGSFIAGPSKTADIEQSLVLGAHGSRTMTLYVIASQ
jgi:L-lactate dehydrogenase complex protein LldG